MEGTWTPMSLPGTPPAMSQGCPRVTLLQMQKLRLKEQRDAQTLVARPQRAWLEPAGHLVNQGPRVPVRGRPAKAAWHPCPQAEPGVKPQVWVWDPEPGAGCSGLLGATWVQVPVHHSGNVT